MPGDAWPAPLPHGRNDRVQCRAQILSRFHLRAGVAVVAADAHVQAAGDHPGDLQAEDLAPKDPVLENRLCAVRRQQFDQVAVLVAGVICEYRLLIRRREGPPADAPHLHTPGELGGTPSDHPRRAGSWLLNENMHTAVHARLQAQRQRRPEPRNLSVVNEDPAGAAPPFDQGGPAREAAGFTVNRRVFAPLVRDERAQLGCTQLGEAVAFGYFLPRLP
jgi:hypothetical protein